MVAFEVPATTNNKAIMPTKPKRKRAVSRGPVRSPEVLDVQGAAALLTVSADTVYNLFQKGELPGRKVGRKWITTKTAVLRWIENTSAGDTLARAIQSGDADALARAMNKGKVRLKPKGN
jgi:excisionase family DNA binding protein